MRRLTPVGVFLALLCVAGPSTGNPIIVGLPAHTNTGNGWPFGGSIGVGSAYNGEYQQLYLGGAFRGPITIAGLEFYNTAYNSFATAMNSGTWTISLSTTSRGLGTLSNEYAANIGTDNTVVFSGNLYQPWEFGNTLAIPFTTPFSYDPANGNLLIDILVRDASAPGGFIYFDMTCDSAVTGRVYGSDGRTGVGWVEAGPGSGVVTGFETPSASVPEPASLLLLFSAGLVGAAGRAWRKSRGEHPPLPLDEPKGHPRGGTFVGRLLSRQ